MDTTEKDFELTDAIVLTKRFRDSNEFSQFIEEEAERHGGYIQAMVTYCETEGVEYESIAKLVNRSLEQKIRKEAEDLLYLKPEHGKLNIDG